MPARGGKGTQWRLQSEISTAYSAAHHCVHNSYSEHTLTLYIHPYVILPSTSRSPEYSEFPTKIAPTYRRPSIGIVLSPLLGDTEVLISRTVSNCPHRECETALDKVRSNIHISTSHATCTAHLTPSYLTSITIFGEKVSINYSR
jgi:hypothetical protein